MFMSMMVYVDWEEISKEKGVDKQRSKGDQYVAPMVCQYVERPEVPKEQLGV